MGTGIWAGRSNYIIKHDSCGRCVIDDTNRRCGKCGGFMEGNKSVVEGNYIKTSFTCNDCGHSIIVWIKYK